MSEFQIDEASYREGRAAFAAGASLRSIVEQCANAAPADEEKVFSGAVGFLDGLLDLLRKPPMLVSMSSLPLVGENTGGLPTPSSEKATT